MTTESEAAAEVGSAESETTRRFVVGNPQNRVFEGLLHLSDDSRLNAIAIVDIPRSVDFVEVWAELEAALSDLTVNAKIVEMTDPQQFAVILCLSESDHCRIPAIHQDLKHALQSKNEWRVFLVSKVSGAAHSDGG